MNSRNRTGDSIPSLIFITLTFREWIPRLKDVDKRNDFQDILMSISKTHCSGLMGYVIMPEHVHILAGCAGGESQLSKYIQTLKSISARRLFLGEGSVWMERYDYFTVTTERQFSVKLNYIHQNPVKRGLVLNQSDWNWSSAMFWEGDDSHAVLTKGWEWMDA